MPEMDGLETVRELRKIDSRVPIIMFSTLTERGAAVTLEALSLGATDYVTKPSNADMTATLDAISRELIPKIRALCRLPETLTSFARPKPRCRLRRPRSTARPRGCYRRCKWWPLESPPAAPMRLARVLPLLPANFPVPVVIAQHMPPIFHIAAGSAAFSKVDAAGAGVCFRANRSRPGCAVIAPGDFHMVVPERRTSVSSKRTRVRRKISAGRPWMCCSARSPDSTAPGHWRWF